MSNLSIFSFESHEIRFIDTAESPWWIAQDICKVLELDDVSKAVSRLDDDEKLIRTLRVSGQGRETLCVNESGLYSLVLTSRKAQAKRFKKWLTSEVIPAIRKTGVYSVQSLRSLTSNAKLVELTDKQNTLRQQIKDMEIALNAKRYELNKVLFCSVMTRTQLINH
ncbi:hypothetical protein HUN01_30525 [Nostoc edaphicum CCNP1411]|uniref:Bro-N domain-containing protein n=1 Tax=Nostoc edaphicum CCNP1411 TaxID=1472755 RepID=A0A7D7QMK1_9NOSO|nr:BRO family protein [Nostoc edaphicum]QMS91721.1 hypothetical protein HUN01_30525 [Nostoc edaphicum CCNP1411]